MRSDKNICAVATLVIHEGQEQAFRAVADGNPDDQVRHAVSDATGNLARFHRPYAGFVR